MGNKTLRSRPNFGILDGFPGELLIRSIAGEMAEGPEFGTKFSQITVLR